MRNEQSNGGHRESQDDVTTVVSDQSQHAAFQAAYELSLLELRTREIAEKLGEIEGDTRIAALKDLADAWRMLGMGAHDYARGFEESARLTRKTTR